MSVSLVAGSKAGWERLLSRVSLRALAWLALAAATGWLVRAESQRPEGLDGVKATIGLVYREVDGRTLKLDVYSPDAMPGGLTTKRPAIIALHGGGWRGGSRSEYGRSLAPLVRQGFVVVSVDYRLSRPGIPSWPANLDDVREAVRWVRRHADSYAIDGDRIAAIGASAGGHLALMLGVWPVDEASRVGAVIDFYGPTDLRALHDRRTTAEAAIDLLLGSAPAPALYKSASPISHVSKDSAPVLIVHGLDDALVPLDQSQALADALERVAVSHRLIGVGGARHGFGVRGETHDLIPEIVSFLEPVWGAGAAGEIVKPPRGSR